MTVFLTGITGLVGSLTAAVLLSRGHSVVALVRGRNGTNAHARARRVLCAHPGHARGVFTIERLAALEGDLTACGRGFQEQSESIRGKIDAFIHTAALVAFGSGSDEALFAVNVAGAAMAVELAASLRSPRFIHVSTAFLDHALEGNGFRTAYERSKLEGEQAVRAACVSAGISCAVARPAIVTGERCDGFTPTFKGAYPFFRYGASAAEESGRILSMPGGFSDDSPVNLVPGDDVAAVLCLLAEHGAEGEYNILNPNPWRAGELLRIAASLAGVGVLARRASHNLSPLLTLAAEELARHYAAYLGVNPCMDTSSVDALRRLHGLQPITNDPAWIEALLRWAVRRNWEEL